MDRMLIAPHMAAADMQDGEFGEGVQRMLNFLVHVYSSVLNVSDDLEIEPVYHLFRVEDQKERVELARLANGDKPVVSQRTSVRIANLSEDDKAEYEAIQGESAASESTSISEPTPNANSRN